jgi:catechol 2,3-dioxygenase-like lactoylglutathione lyase family enzyme
VGIADLVYSGRWRSPVTVLACVNVFVRNLDGIVSFYVDLLGLKERKEQRSPIYRALDAGGTDIGFNAVDAYALLNLDSSPPTGTGFMLTFDVGARAEIERLVALAEQRGATLVKPAYDTSYGARQAVLRDPEGNVFRVNAFQPAGEG